MFVFFFKNLWQVIIMNDGSTPKIFILVNYICFRLWNVKAMEVYWKKLFITSPLVGLFHVFFQKLVTSNNKE